MKFIQKNIILVGLLAMSFLTGQNPPGINWKQIKTDRYHIVFPEELGSEANRVANIMEHVHYALYDSLDEKHMAIPIVLSNRGSVPNGFVGMAPWMSEWYNVPLINREMGHTEWYRNLAIHEGRHIVQFNNLNQGVSRWLRILFGQSTQSFYTHLLLPDWYWEGDAVDIETAFTHSGRGRSAHFTRIARSYVLSGTRLLYQNAFYGSFKTEYPNHYELGYYLTTHLKKEYGEKTWPKIIQKTMQWPFMVNPLYPLSHAIKTTTGSSLPQIYYDTFYDLEMVWKDQSAELKQEPVTNLTPLRKTTTHYRYPAMTDEGSYIALKSGLGDVHTIVKIDNGKEITLKHIEGSSEIFGFHTNGKQVVWSAYDPDVRWSKRSWANIRVYDINTKETKLLTKNRRVYEPNISRDGQKIAAVSFSQDRYAFLVIIDRRTGDILDQVEAPNGGLIMAPSWSEDGKHIIFAAQKYNGRALYAYRLQERKFHLVKPESWQHIYNPVFYKGFILFESQINGIDQIVARHLGSNDEYQITSRVIGAYNPFITSDGNLLFNDYTKMGDGIALLKLDQSYWTKINSDQRSIRTNYFTEHGSKSIFDDDMKKRSYEIEEYTGLSSQFNFHSRYIFNNDFDPTFGIQSDNLLRTLSFSGEFVYHQNEKTNEKRIRSVIRNFYPIFDVEIGWMDRLVAHGKFVNYIDNDRNKDSIVFHVKEKWSESIFNFGATMPLVNRIDGIQNQFAYIKIGSKYTLRQKTVYHFDFDYVPPNVRVASSQVKNDRNGGILPIYIEGVYSSLNEKAPRDLGNRGWQFYAYGGSAPFGGIWKGQQLSFRFIFGSKGLNKHHFIDTRFQYETNKGDQIFLSKFHFPYGYIWHTFSSAWQSKVRYKMPLAYPDWSTPFGITYLKRIQGNIFGHFAQVDTDQNMLSIGAGMTFEVGGFFNTKLPIPLTVNYYFQPYTGKSGVELVFD